MDTINTPPRLALEGVHVEFGPTKALDDINLAIQPGEIVGLLGHNGAGKTTLFNAVSGVITPTAGRILIDGTPIPAKASPRDTAGMGITIIHQEPALSPNLSVLDNLFLARNMPRSIKARKRLAEEALHRVGADVDLDIPVGMLPLGQRQLIDLARGSLGGDVRVLLLDEPTAALGRAETDALHALIRSLSSQGTAVVYVSHRLPDILEVCTRIVVLRGGQLAVDGSASDFDGPRLANALVPEIREMHFVQANKGAEAFRIPTRPELTFNEGEVIGLFGMAGGEQFDLIRGLAGAAQPHIVELDGKTLRISDPSQAIKAGIFYVPPDRDTEGLIAAQSAIDTVMLPWYGNSRARGWWVTPRTGKDIYSKARKGLDILGPSGEAEISQFSGGNRQKHLLSRWLYPAKPRVLMLAQPTQGVDVGARLDIVDAVRSTAASGTTVLVASAESDEIEALCDRAYVFSRGKVAPVSRTETFNADLLATLLDLAATTAA